MRKLIIAVLICSGIYIAGCGGGGSIQNALETKINGSGMGSSAQHVVYVAWKYDEDARQLRSVEIATGNEIAISEAGWFEWLETTDSSDTVFYIWASQMLPYDAYEVYSVKTDGSGSARVTNNTGFEYMCKYGRKSGRIYYSHRPVAGEEVGQSEIYAVSPPAMAQTKVFETAGEKTFFDIAPDESFFVYVETIFDNAKLHKYDPMTGQTTDIVSAIQASDYVGSYFKISPDSSKIAYFSDCSYSGMSCRTLNVIDKNGVLITSEETYSYSFSSILSWSPDSTAIITNDNFYVMSFDIVKNLPRVIFNNTDTKSYYITDWSDDGKYIVGAEYNYDSEGEFDYSNLIMANPDGTGLRRLTNNVSGSKAVVTEPHFAK